MVEYERGVADERVAVLCRSRERAMMGVVRSVSLSRKEIRETVQRHGWRSWEPTTYQFEAHATQKKTKKTKEHRRHKGRRDGTDRRRKIEKGGRGGCRRERARRRRAGVLQPVTSDVDLTHHGSHVPRSDNLNGLHEVPDGFVLLGRDGDVDGAEVVLQVRQMGRARNGNCLRLIHDPGEGELVGGATLLGSELREDRRGLSAL